MSFPIIHGIIHYLMEFPFCTFPSYYRPRATLRDCWRPLEHSVYHEPTRVKPDHGLDPARLMGSETRAARSLPQGSSLEYIGS